MAQDYIFAAARTRVLELALYSDQTIEELLKTPSYEAALSFLREHGWGDSSIENPSEEEILSYEENKTRKTVEELAAGNHTAFLVLSLPKIFHNLKAALKTLIFGGIDAKIYYDNTNPSYEDILSKLHDKNFASLPSYMQAPAKEAYEALLHTKDGQLMDCIIDRGTLVAIKEEAQKSPEKLVAKYGELLVATADIKIALRGARTKKSEDFFKRALAPCDSLNIARLTEAAKQGEDRVLEYLKTTRFSDASESYQISPSVFECWCDNQIIQMIQPEKYDSFTLGTVVAYQLARQNEIKTVRIILSGKRNNLPEENLRERIRRMYV